MENWKRIVLKFAGLGVGFPVTAGIIVGVAVWWSNRPVKPKPMNAHAIIGNYTGTEMQVRGEELHLTLTYGLHNTTDRDYSLLAAGELMSVNSENKGLDGVEGSHGTVRRSSLPVRP